MEKMEDSSNRSPPVIAGMEVDQPKTLDDNIIMAPTSKGGWPGWAKCVMCYDKYCGRVQDNNGDDSAKIQALYGERDFFFLPCAHVICSTQCLQECRVLPVPAEELGTNTEIRKKEDSKCPACDQQFASTTMLENKNTLRPLEVICRVAPEIVRLNKKCQGCIRKNVFSVKYCKDCSLALCKHCVDQHSFMIDTSEHSVIESPENIYDFVSKSEICNGHPTQRLIAYCNDCDLQLCQMCISEGKHARHDTCDLKQFAKKTVESLKNLYTEHSKIANDYKAAREYLQQELEALEERTKKIRSESACALENIVSLITQKELDLTEDIISAVTVNALTLGLRNSCYKSLISQAEAFRLFAQIFDFVDLPQNNDKFELMSRFYKLMKEHVKYTKKTMADNTVEELPLDIALINNSAATLEAIEGMYRIEWELELPNPDSAPADDKPKEGGGGPLRAAERTSTSILSENSQEVSRSTPLNPTSSTRDSLATTPNDAAPPSHPPTSTPTVVPLSPADDVVNEVEVTSTHPPSSSERLGNSLPSSLQSVVEDMIISPLSVSSEHPISPESLPNEKSASTSRSCSVYRLEPESDDEDAQRVAFLCDDDDESSDDERIRIKKEPVDYEDRDEEPPDDVEDGHDDAPIIMIKKEIDYDSYSGEQDYEAMNGYGHAILASRTPVSFFCRSNSNTSSEDGEKNLILAHQRRLPPRSQLIKGGVARNGSKKESLGRKKKTKKASRRKDHYIVIDDADSSNSPSESLAAETSEKLAEMNIPHKLTTTTTSNHRVPNINETMISTSQQEEYNKKTKVAEDFQDEFILPNVPSPFSDHAASDEEFFKNVLPNFANLTELQRGIEDTTTDEPEVILDPETGLLVRRNSGLLVRRDSGCVVDSDADIVEPEQAGKKLSSESQIAASSDTPNASLTKEKQHDGDSHQPGAQQTLPNVEKGGDQSIQSDKNSKTIECPTLPSSNTNNSTLLITKILLPGVSPTKVVISTNGNPPSPSSSFTVNSLTPNLLKFAHSKTSPPAIPRSSLQRRPIAKRGPSASVEIQTDQISQYINIPKPKRADLSIVKTEPIPYHHREEEESSALFSLAAAASTSTPLTTIADTTTISTPTVSRPILSIISTPAIPSPNSAPLPKKISPNITVQTQSKPINPPTTSNPAPVISTPTIARPIASTLIISTPHPTPPPPPKIVPNTTVQTQQAKLIDRPTVTRPSILSHPLKASTEQQQVATALGGGNEAVDKSLKSGGNHQPTARLKQRALTDATVDMPILDRPSVIIPLSKTASAASVDSISPTNVDRSSLPPKKRPRYPSHSPSSNSSTNQQTINGKESLASKIDSRRKSTSSESGQSTPTTTPNQASKELTASEIVIPTLRLRRISKEMLSNKNESLKTLETLPTPSSTIDSNITPRQKLNTKPKLTASQGKPRVISTEGRDQSAIFKTVEQPKTTTTTTTLEPPNISVAIPVEEPPKAITEAPPKISIIVELPKVSNASTQDPIPAIPDVNNLKTAENLNTKIDDKEKEMESSKINEITNNSNNNTIPTSIVEVVVHTAPVTAEPMQNQQEQDSTPPTACNPPLSAGQKRLNRIFKSKNLDDVINQPKHANKKQTMGRNKSVFHEMYDSFLTSAEDSNEITGETQGVLLPQLGKRKRGRPFKNDPPPPENGKKAVTTTRKRKTPNQPPPEGGKRKRGRPVGWRKSAEGVSKEGVNGKPKTTPPMPVLNNNQTNNQINNQKDNKRPRLRSSRQSSPASSHPPPPPELLLSPTTTAAKIKIKLEAAERPDNENGDSSDFEFNSDDEVAPPPPASQESTTSSSSSSTSSSSSSSSSSCISSRRLSSRSNTTTTSDGRPVSRSRSRGSSYCSSPDSRPRKRNRSARWSARLIRSQSMESTASNRVAVGAAQSSPKNKKGGGEGGGKGRESCSPGKTGIGPKLILTRSKTPTSRPDTPASLCLSVDSM